MTKIFEKRQNYDLRKQLAGTERLIDHLLVNDTSNKKSKYDEDLYTYLGKNTLRSRTKSILGRIEALFGYCPKKPSGRQIE